MLLPTLHGDGGTAVNGGTVAVGFFGWRYDGGGILLDGGADPGLQPPLPAPVARTPGQWPLLVCHESHGHKQKVIRLK